MNKCGGSPTLTAAMSPLFLCYTVCINKTKTFSFLFYFFKVWNSYYHCIKLKRKARTAQDVTCLRLFQDQWCLKDCRRLRSWVHSRAVGAAATYGDLESSLHHQDLLPLLQRQLRSRSLLLRQLQTRRGKPSLMPGRKTEKTSLCLAQRQRVGHSVGRSPFFTKGDQFCIIKSPVDGKFRSYWFLFDGVASFRSESPPMFLRLRAECYGSLVSILSIFGRGAFAGYIPSFPKIKPDSAVVRKDQKQI